MVREEFKDYHKINFVNISFRNNGTFDERAINTPIINKIDNFYGEKVVGVITDVNKDFVSGILYEEAIPEINKNYVCSVELKGK